MADVCLRELNYPGYETYPSFDHVWVMVFTCKETLVIYISLYMTNSIPVSDYCIIFPYLTGPYEYVWGRKKGDIYNATSRLLVIGGMKRSERLWRCDDDVN